MAAVWATSHFRQYLIGNRFTLVTDHEPIKWILSTEKLSAKLARWALLLQEFDFKVEHRASAENGNAIAFPGFPWIPWEDLRYLTGSGATSLSDLRPFWP